MSRPHLFIRSQSVDGARSLGDVRSGLSDTHAAQLWKQLLDKTARELEEPPWTPSSALPSRKPQQIAHANREYELVAYTANRILDAALVGLLEDDRRYAESVCNQIRTVYDVAAWPEIEDKTHLAHGDHCSLRSGQLAFAIGCAYDWLYNLLTEAERTEILEGFDRRFTRQFRAALEHGDRWVNWRHNFCVVIYGGFAIAGMAFGDDYAESGWLLEVGKRPMDGYFDSLFGPEGEFNESVQYAGSAATAVYYLTAQQCHAPASTHPIVTQRLDAFCRWYMHFTLPPGRVAGFGDPAPDLPPVVFHYSAVASALRDGNFQWFYRQYADHTRDTHRKRAIELLFYDPTVEAVDPTGHLSLGHAYHAQGKLISSRSSWDPDSAESIVYSKAAREHNHSHPDWGQVCLDGYGDRLLRDLGSPPAYPRDDRDRYYNYQQWGHNVLLFGKNETGGVSIAERDLAGSIERAEFDDERGGWWRLDLSSVYSDTQSVTRTVVHLLPRILVVVDEATLDHEIPISLRWHTADTPELLPDGNLTVHSDHATLSGCVMDLDGRAMLRTSHQEYLPPYDVDALGDPQPQRHEPYVELAASGDRCRFVSLFCVQTRSAEGALWSSTSDGWEIETDEGVVSAEVGGSRISVEGPRGSWVIEDG